MKTRNIFAAFAAACTAAVVTSQAAALICYTPAPSFFADVISTENDTVVLTCESTPNQGNPTTAKAIGGGGGDILIINLITGSRARIGGYNSSRQGINCSSEDTSPNNLPEGINCPPGTLAFYDMTLEG
jgi:hypothetical protein